MLKLSNNFKSLDDMKNNKIVLKKIIYTNKICFNDFYTHFGFDSVNNFYKTNNFEKLLTLFNNFPDCYLKNTVVFYFKFEKHKTLSFLKMFFKEIKNNKKYCNKFEIFLDIFDSLLYDIYILNKYDVIIFLNEIYFYQIKETLKTKSFFIHFYKKNMQYFESIKLNSFIMHPEKEIYTDSEPTILFHQLHSNFNECYQESLKLTNLKYKGSKRGIYCYHSSFQKRKETEAIRSYFLAKNIEITKNLKNNILRYNNKYIKLSFSEKTYNKTLASIEKFFLMNKYNNKLNDSLTLILKNYLFHASYSYFKLNIPTLSCMYIYLFFHAINVHCTGEKNNDVNIGLDFFLELCPNLKKHDRAIFLSFLTKENMGFDIRSGILHSIGFDFESVEVFIFYFFSFLTEEYFVDFPLQFDNNDFQYAFNYKDIISNIDNNLNIPESLTMLEMEDFLFYSNNHVSLFILYFIQLEDYLFQNVDNGLYYKDDFVFYKGFRDLKNEFCLTSNYKNNVKIFDDVFNSLKYYIDFVTYKVEKKDGKVQYKTNDVNIRNYIFHNPNKNIFEPRIEELLKEFNINFKELKVKMDKDPIYKIKSRFNFDYLFKNKTLLSYKK